MSLFEHPKTFDHAESFSRFDLEHPLATVSEPTFTLEDRVWPTAEHYYQFSKQRDVAWAEKIAHTSDPIRAYKLGNRWYKRKRPDFQQLRLVLMTRALYSKASQNPEVAEYLLSTDDRLLVETSLYDHFWGIGRDQRGQNQLGKVWMNIRQKLKAQNQTVDG